MRVINGHAAKKLIHQYNPGGKMLRRETVLKLLDSLPELDPVYIAGGCYCRECEKLFIENMTRNTAEPFSEMAFCKARARGEFVMAHCRLYGVARGPADFCSYGRRKADVDV